MAVFDFIKKFIYTIENDENLKTMLHNGEIVLNVYDYESGKYIEKYENWKAVKSILLHMRDVGQLMPTVEKFLADAAGLMNDFSPVDEYKQHKLKVVRNFSWFINLCLDLTGISKEIYKKTKTKSKSDKYDVSEDEDKLIGKIKEVEEAANSTKDKLFMLENDIENLKAKNYGLEKEAYALILKLQFLKVTWWNGIFNTKMSRKTPLLKEVSSVFNEFEKSRIGKMLFDGVDYHFKHTNEFKEKTEVIFNGELFKLFVNNWMSSLSDKTDADMKKNLKDSLNEVKLFSKIKSPTDEDVENAANVLYHMYALYSFRDCW